MPGLLSTLEPQKAVLPVIALIGFVPVLIHYRSEAKLFVLGYVCLIVATLATNLEDLFLGGFLNFTEHAVGLMGSGLLFLTAAYLRRQQVVGDDEGAETVGEAVGEVSDAVFGGSTDAPQEA
ncbi:MAG: hypothetical protein ABEH40_04530 [Haloferacaceae archaeon]